nr:hypothetical protein GCM10025732_13660 [Glycomyces mayteni]
MSGSKTIVHLLRHGEVHNPEGILYGRLPGYGLSELGREMAVAAAERLAKRDIVHVGASPSSAPRRPPSPSPPPTASTPSPTTASSRPGTPSRASRSASATAPCASPATGGACATPSAPPGARRTSTSPAA